MAGKSSAQGESMEMEADGIVGEVGLKGSVDLDFFGLLCPVEGLVVKGTGRMRSFQLATEGADEHRRLAEVCRARGSSLAAQELGWVWEQRHGWVDGPQQVGVAESFGYR